MNVLRLSLVLFAVLASHLVFLVKVLPFIQMRRVFIMEFFEECNGKALPAKYTNFSFIRNGSAICINGKETYDRDLQNPISFQMRLDKCKDKSNLNTCDYFTTLKWDDFCAAVRLVPFLQSIFDKTTPPLSCPMKKGHYFIKDLRFNLDTIAAFMGYGNGSESLLKVRYMMFERSQMVLCTDSGVRFANVRRRH